MCLLVSCWAGLTLWHVQRCIACLRASFSREFNATLCKPRCCIVSAFSCTMVIGAAILCDASKCAEHACSGNLRNSNKQR